MVTISHPTLAVEAVPDHPGRRLLVVEFDLETQPGDMSTEELVESVVVRSTDLGDAPVRPSDLRVELRRGPGPHGQPNRHRFERQVARVALDVEQDWWRAGPAGEVEPLSEFADHLVADITIREMGPVVATAATPVVSGSWGVLGAD